MSLEENKAIIRSLVEAFNKHNVALLDEFIAPDFVDAPNTPFEVRGLEKYKEFETAFIKGFPDYHETIGKRVLYCQDALVFHKGNLCIQSRSSLPCVEANHIFS